MTSSEEALGVFRGIVALGCTRKRNGTPEEFRLFNVGWILAKGTAWKETQLEEIFDYLFAFQRQDN